MKCARDGCANDATEDPFCSIRCRNMFMAQRDRDFVKEIDRKKPENTLLRIEEKLDKLLSILTKE